MDAHFEMPLSASSSTFSDPKAEPAKGMGHTRVARGAGDFHAYNQMACPYARYNGCDFSSQEVDAQMEDNFAFLAHLGVW